MNGILCDERIELYGEEDMKTMLQVIHRDNKYPSSTLPYVMGLAEQESRFCHWKLVFETGFFFNQIHRKFKYTQLKEEIGASTLNQVTKPVEELSRAFRFGVLQVLGQTIREYGYRGILHHIIFRPDIGIDFGLKHFHSLFFRYDGNLDKALHAYTAGVAVGNSSDIPYVIEVRRRIQRIENNGQYGCR